MRQADVRDRRRRPPRDTWPGKPCVSPSRGPERSALCFTWRGKPHSAYGPRFSRSGLNETRSLTGVVLNYPSLHEPVAGTEGTWQLELPGGSVGGAF